MEPDQTSSNKPKRSKVLIPLPAPKAYHRRSRCRSPAAGSAAVDNHINDLVRADTTNRARIVVFNNADGWCGDVTLDLADELTAESDLQFLDTSRR